MAPGAREAERMNAGPELDAAIARRLWKAIVMVEGGVRVLVEANTKKSVPLPGYSTILDEAYRVVARMQSEGWEARIGADDDGRCRAVFAKGDGRLYLWTYAQTGPEAICLAALAAVEGRNYQR